MAADLTRVLRGALAGAAAAGVWAAQQPLDKRVFGVDYDDAELLGSIFTRKRGGTDTFLLGTAMHLVNGALFGAVYAAAAPGVPAPGAVRGMAAAMGENLATWPLTALVKRAHPVGREFPQLWGDRRAFAQATWRHLLFGAILGLAEERLNPPAGEAAPAEDDHSSSNGHGNLSHVVVTPA
jgi:hypothetical protein